MENAIGAPPPPRKRGRFRFSLRTLLLFVLTCGGGMTIWTNGKLPWVWMYRIQENGAPVLTGFSPDDKAVYAVFAKTPGDDYWISIFDADSGRRKYTIPCGATYCVPEFSPGGTYLFVKDLKTRQPVSRRLTATGAEFQWKNLNTYNEGADIVISAHDRFLAAREHVERGAGRSTRIILLSLPDCDVLRRWESDGDPVFSADESLVACVDKTRKEIQVVPTNGALPEVKWGTDRLGVGYFNMCCFSPDAVKLAVEMADRKTAFFETTTGKWLGDVDGYMYSTANPFSSNGQSFLTYGDRGTQVWNLDPFFALSWAENRNAVIGFSANGERLFTKYPVAAYDVQTGKSIWQSRPSDDILFGDPGMPATGAPTGFIHPRVPGERDGSFTLKLASETELLLHRNKFYDAQTGMRLFDLTEHKIPGEITAFSNVRSDFIVQNGDELQYWRKRDAYVFTHMPAVWLTAVLVVLFSISIWKDRRIGMR